MFGSSHFFNGVLSRRVPAMNIAVCSQLGGAFLFGGWTLARFDGGPSGQDLFWAAVSGVGAGLGVAALYEGMRRCRISVVVPVTSIVSVALPFLASVIILGDRIETPLALAALLLVPATWLLSRPASASHTKDTSPVVTPPERSPQETSANNAVAVALGLVAGLGYATQLFALSRISSPEPAAPMLVSQIVSVIPLVLLLYYRSGRWLPAGGGATLSKAAGVGGLAALAMVSYLYATREVALAPVMIAIALYPALPVILALVVLKERLSTPQIGGLGIAAIVLPLINLTG
ncbi:hypothetical protein CXR29_03845 [Brevibacterium linens]|jgi:drug/metabolite transporter (DMT)-like permease|nr:hypothetical protein CXR29_03845 [Brevibacterium linens]